MTSIFGALLGGFLMDIYGPRKTLVLTAIPCVLSWGLIAFAHSIYLVYLGRLITGIFLGIYSPVPQVSSVIIVTELQSYITLCNLGDWRLKIIHEFSNFFNGSLLYLLSLKKKWFLSF